MSKFQVVSPHLPAECILAGEELLAKDPELYEEIWLGCDFGDHTAYVVVDAADAEAARARFPAFLRQKARVVRVEHPDPDKLRADHTNLT